MNFLIADTFTDSLARLSGGQTRKARQHGQPLHIVGRNELGRGVRGSIQQHAAHGLLGIGGLLDEREHAEHGYVQQREPHRRRWRQCHCAARAVFDLGLPRCGPRAAALAASLRRDGLQGAAFNMLPVARRVARTPVRSCNCLGRFFRLIYP